MDRTRALRANSDLFKMTVNQLDFYFPFVVFFYGFLAVTVVETPALFKLGSARGGVAFENLVRRKKLAWISFFLGGLWALQNVWFG